MKNQKVLVGIAFAALFIPQVVFAAWYNPLSWSIFSWLFNQTPRQENSISISTSTTETANIKSDNTIASPKQKNALQSTQSQNVTIEKVVQPQMVVPTVPPNSNLCNGTYYAACSGGENLVCPSNGAVAYCQSSTPATQPAPDSDIANSPTVFAMKAQCQTLGQAKQAQEDANYRGGGFTSGSTVAYGYSISLNTCIYGRVYTMYQFNSAFQRLSNPLVYSGSIWDLLTGKEIYIGFSLMGNDAAGDVDTNVLQQDVNNFWAYYNNLAQ